MTHPTWPRRAGFLLAPVSLLAASAHAQAPTSTQSPLEEIIVKATLIDRTLDRVPAAVSVVTQDDIQGAQPQIALDEALKRVPGVFMQDRYNFAQDLRVSIRGFGARSQFGIRGIKVIVDGIPETLPDGQGAVDSIDLGATRQIEVIRGPSSSMYGNAAGGVISIATEGAPAGGPFTELRVASGSNGYEKKQFKAGDEVYARPADHRIGTFAELIAIQEKDLALKPKNLTMEEAASIPLVGLTAWQALVERGQLKQDQKVFIQAGSGGVGTFAIQLAKHLGATVATTTSASNADMVRSLGADVIVDYKTEDFETKLSGYDLVLHSQDGKALEKSLRVLRPGGRLVSISGPPTPEFAEQIGAPWYVKLVASILSFGTRRRAKSLGTPFSFLFMKASGDQLRQLATLIEAGAVRPVVDRVFPFQSTNDALAYVETGRAKGKVVIKVK